MIRRLYRSFETGQGRTGTSLSRTKGKGRSPTPIKRQEMFHEAIRVLTYTCVVLYSVWRSQHRRSS
jgi:hypothetical protein